MELTQAQMERIKQLHGGLERAEPEQLLHVYESMSPAAKANVDATTGYVPEMTKPETTKRKKTKHEPAP